MVFAASQESLTRTAELQLRGGAGPLRARVTWPDLTDARRAPALIVLLAQGNPARAEALTRALSEHAAVVVLLLNHGTAADGLSAVEWAADHAGELDADPARLVVAGEHAGGARAAALALYARDNRWPVIGRQVLIHPHFDVRPASVAGVAPATVVTSASGDGRRYATQLRAAGVAVEVLRCRAATLPLDDLARSLRDDDGENP